MCYSSCSLMSLHRNLFIVIIFTVSSSLTNDTDVENNSIMEKNARAIRSYVSSKSEPPPRPNLLPSLVTEKPYFNMADDDVTVTVQLGKVAYLECQVNKIADKTVSWVRKKDYHILTVDTYTYTRDIRFKAIHQRGSNVWTLAIGSTRYDDAGYYQCQVNSEPKISKSIKLVLVAAKVEILGAPALSVKKGSTINLTCQVTDATQAPVYVFWYHNGKVINYDNPRDWITVETEKSITTTSNLKISSAEDTDSGMYSCAPSYADPAQISVSVIDGEKPAAMQSGHQNSSPLLSSIFIYPLFLSISISNILEIVS